MQIQKMIVIGLVAFTFLFGLWCVISPAYNWFVDNFPLEFTILVGFIIIIVGIKFFGRHL